MTVTNYKISNIKNFEEFLNKLFNGLKYYQTRYKNFKFKITYTKDNIELKTIRFNESAN